MDTCVFRSSKADTALTLHCLATTPCMSRHDVTLGQAVYCGICGSRHHVTLHQGKPVCVLSLPSLLIDEVMFCHKAMCGLLI